jgi:phosphate transport system ATP-binding protein
MTVGAPAAAAAPVADTEHIAIRAHGLDSWYGSVQALKGISLDIPKCRVTALIGPSGCGKSTFLRWINRMNDPIPGARASGTLTLHGDDLLSRSLDVVELRRRVGMVFQKPNPFPSMTIGQNVLSGLKLAQIKKSNTDDLLESCLTRAGLWSEVKDRLGEHGGALSGGQQQRLCIARSLAVEPQVLLMDEPCSALDPGSTFRIEETIADLAKSMTIVIVTHNMQQAARVSDYTAFFLSDGGPGEMIEAAPTSRIFSSPQDKRTEDYVTGRFG